MSAECGAGVGGVLAMSAVRLLTPAALSGVVDLVRWFLTEAVRVALPAGHPGLTWLLSLLGGYLYWNQIVDRLRAAAGGAGLGGG
jgi:hypothetical protein